jgi:competence protein ComEC
MIICALVVISIYQLPGSNLRVIACDVGQGDAVLIIYKNIEILTDGGNPNGKVSVCLSKYMPFWDREIEVVINSHPQLDHYGGLIEVFKNYKVDYFVANALDSGASQYQVLKKEVGSGGTHVVNPVAGTRLRLSLIHLDIFWPSRDFLINNGFDFKGGELGTFTYKGDLNDFSVQAIASFGNFRILLTGDIGHNLESRVIPNLPKEGVDYIKIPHHGSKYGLTPDYLNVITPKIAVISVGKNNTYGHPSPEITDLLKSRGITTYRTDETGNVVIETDGKSFWLK